MQTLQESLAKLTALKRHFRSVGISDDEVVRAIKSVPRHYAANFVQNTSEDATSSGRSALVWKKFKLNQFAENNNNGAFLWEDWLAFAGQTGANGSLTRISSTLSPSAVGSSTCASQTFAFSGTLASDLPVSVQKPTFQAGLAIDQNILIGAANSLSLNFINPTASAITPTSSQSYVLTVLRLNGFYTGGSSGGWRSQEGGATAGSVAALTSDMPVGPGGLATAMGTIRLSTGAAAHNSVALESLGGQWGIGASAAATVPLAAVLPRLHFECRVRFNQSTVQSAFLGLATPGQTSGMNTLFNGSDAWQNIASIGFRVNGASSTSNINCVYATTTGTTAVSSSTATLPSTITNWTKLGFVVDPFDPTAALQYYQDGVLVGSQTLAALTAANWPSDVALTPVIYLQAQGSGGAAVTLDLDWVGVGECIGIN